MNFFSKFPLSTYQFSDKETTVITDLFRYVSAEDKKLDGIINYTYYSVPEGMRPDVLSSKLYGTPDFHWSFFIINTALKQAGLGSWPKGIAELENFIFEKYMKYGVIEMNSKTIPFKYTFTDNNEQTIIDTSITTKSLNGIVLDSDIDIVSLDKRYKSQFVSYKDDRIILNKNTISSLSFSPNNEIYWNLPKIKLISEEGYNAEVSFKFSDSVHGQGSTLSDQITVLNRGENYFTAPQVEVDESPERECVFSFNFTDDSLATGTLVISYPGKNYCRVPKVIFKIPSIGYVSEPLNVFEIDSSKNYGLKVVDGFYILPEEISELMPANNPNLYSLELTNRDKPLNTPVVLVSNSSAIDEKLAIFNLQNNSLNVVKKLKWNVDLLNWILNNRIDILSSSKSNVGGVTLDVISSTDIDNLKLDKDLSSYLYTILKAIEDKANETLLNPSSDTDASIRLTVGEMASYFTNTKYSVLANEIRKVFIDSGIDFDSQDLYLTSNEDIDRLFYEGFNYKNKLNGEKLGISEGWNIPGFFYRRGFPATAPVFSLENLYGPYTLTSGRGSILFGNETIAVQNDPWDNKGYIPLGGIWYSFRVKKNGSNPRGVFNIFTDGTIPYIGDKSVGIKLSGNTVFDSTSNPESGYPSYIHSFNGEDTVTILGKLQPLFQASPAAALHTLWFNPTDGFSQSELGNSNTRKSVNRYIFSGGVFNLQLKLSGMGFDTNTGFYIDEIRIGNTFESVTKNPPISVPEIKNYLSDTAEKIISPSLEKLIFKNQLIHGDAQNATHHYEDSAGNQLSYYTGVNNLNGTGNARITNFEYEVDLNDQRREIKIVRPEYIKQFDSIYNTLINS